MPTKIRRRRENCMQARRKTKCWSGTRPLRPVRSSRVFLRRAWLFRSEFDITSQGPCNIWGLVLTCEGEAWIQEANDYGYPAMPFHTYANYPGCSDAQFKSYAPEFPGTAPDFQMGGTGLSGLALSDEPKTATTQHATRNTQHTWPAPYAGI